jgi:Bacterial tandem repeat domain 1
MQLRNISAYVDLDNTVKLTAIMGPPTGQSWWWYSGLRGEDVGTKLSQNKAQLVDISPYIAPDGTLRFAVIMVGANEPYQWCWGLTGREVGQKLQASKMQLRNISAYVDLDNTVKLTAIMGPPTGQLLWWYWGQTAQQVSALLQQNKAVLTKISPYLDHGSLRFAIIMAPFGTSGASGP